MMITVPQSALGIAENHYRELCLQFKWVDSSSAITTMEQFYEDGDCAPLGRMNFVYQNYIPGVSVVKYPELETETETDPVTDAPTDTATEAPTETATEAPSTLPESVPSSESESTSGGCSSVVLPSALVTLTGLCCGAVLTLKRRKQD